MFEYSVTSNWNMNLLNIFKFLLIKQNSKESHFAGFELTHLFLITTAAYCFRVCSLNTKHDTQQ